MGSDCAFVPQYEEVQIVKLTRQRAGLSEEPTQALIDSQSVKTTGSVEQKGFVKSMTQKQVIGEQVWLLSLIRH